MNQFYGFGLCLAACNCTSIRAERVSRGVAPGLHMARICNSCPKGLLEDANEMRVVKKNMESTGDAHPNTAELVRKTAFR